ncbi:MAG: carbon-nitrogen hydrolase [Candidatus Ancaeobacter aquaticus]|nr:carbon-nitrogen hydrolase [Candidatus Ancaeobacter aquaticus]
MDNKRNVTVGLVQMSCKDNTASNLDKAKKLIVAAAEKGAQIICLQELFQSIYFCQTEDIANFDCAIAVDEKSPMVQELGDIASRYNVVIVSSVFEKRAEGVYHNTAFVVDADGKYLGKYRKMHIPDDPHYYEKFYFAPGDLGYKVFKTKYADIGVLICWDQWYPEAARLTALNGAEIIFYPTAIGWLPCDKKEYGFQQHNAWETIQRSHAIANGCYVAATNRVGFEKSPDGKEGIEFWGQSFVAGTSGEILEKASCDKEEIVTATLDLTNVKTTRVMWPFLRDRRIDSYSDIVKRFIEKKGK